MIVRNDPKNLLLYQIEHFYGTEAKKESKSHIEKVYPRVLEKIEYNFSHIHNKYYRCGEDALFDPLHGVQWLIFLYTISHEIYSGSKSKESVCDMIYNISRGSSAADILYGVQMPTVWFCDHPLGSVMGRAKYGNFFFFTQGCTVGGNKDIFPKLGEHVIMFSDSKVLGKCNVGDYVVFSANSYIIDMDIPKYSIVFGQGRDAFYKRITLSDYLVYSKGLFNV